MAEEGRSRHYVHLRSARSLPPVSFCFVSVFLFVAMPCAKALLRAAAVAAVRAPLRSKCASFMQSK